MTKKDGVREDSIFFFFADWLKRSNFVATNRKEERNL